MVSRGVHLPAVALLACAWLSGAQEARAQVPQLVKNIAPYGLLTDPNWVDMNGILYFGSGGNGQIEQFGLWRSDGTASGTFLVRHLNDGGGLPARLTVVGGTLFFVGPDPVTGRSVLWKSNGTTAGTVVVKDIAIGPGSSFPSFPGDPEAPSKYRAVGSTLFFTASDGPNGFELWRSDGTAAGTVMVKDIAPGGLSSHPSGFASVGNRL